MMGPEGPLPVAPRLSFWWWIAGDDDLATQL